MASKDYSSSHEVDQNVDILVNDEAGVETSLSLGNLLRRRTPRLFSSPPSTTTSKEDANRPFFADGYLNNATNISRNQQGRSDSIPPYIPSEETEDDSEPEIDLTEQLSSSSSTSHDESQQQTMSEQEFTLSEYATSSSSSSPRSSLITEEAPPPPSSDPQQAFPVSPSSNSRGDPRIMMRPMFGNRSETSPGPYQAPTKLHELCHQAETIDDLMKARSSLLKLNLERKEILGWSSMRDSRGRLPLHLISDNKTLAEDVVWGGDQVGNDDFSLFSGIVPKSSFADDPSREMVAANFIVDFLLAANPSCIMSRDSDGKIPFEAAITDWVNPWYEEMLHSHMMRSRQGGKDSFHQAAPKAVFHALRFSMHYAAKKTMGSSTKRTNNPGPMNESSATHSSNQVNTAGDSKMLSATSRKSSYMGISKELTRSKCFPAHIKLSGHVSFALRLLSKIVERLESLSSTRSSMRGNSLKVQSPTSLQEVDSFDKAIEESFRGSCAYEEIKDAIVFNIASIPDFVKTIFLIDNEEEHRFALSTTIVRRVLMNKHSVGNWLTSMLQSGDKVVSGRAVHYLNCVSDISAVEKPFLNAAKSSSDLSRANHHRDDLHNEISRLPDFVPSLLALGERGMEEAATSMVVRRVMDRIISRPFAVTVIVCDALFLALLIIGFRGAVNTLLVRGDSGKVMEGIYLANTGIFYFVIREIGKAISLCMITHRARDYLWSFWNLTDLAATVFALASVIAIRSTSRSDEGLDIIDMHGLRDFLAVTTGFLWLRVLNMLKGINMQMATFILAILQITKDTFSFGIILAIMVWTFGQMFYTILIPDYCSSEEAVEDPEYQCVQSEYIFRVYTILLGDFSTFERETFKTKFSIFLMVFYSFMVIIVLLNVLIALASDSYEKCLMKSQMLFGRARVMLVAEIGCFQNLLRKTHQDDGISRLDSTSNPKVFDKWWSDVPAFARGWSRGSIIFFCLSSLVVLFWAVGEMAGHISGERHGNLIISIVSLLANVALFAAMMLFLSHHGKSENSSVSLESNISSVESNDSEQTGLPAYLHKVPSYLQKLLLRLMGSSQDSWNHVRKKDQKQENMWRGRVHHLQSQMDQRAQEARDLAIKQSQALEQLVAATELRLKTEMAGVDHRVGDLKSDLLQEMKLSQDEMLKQIKTCLSKGYI